jgi:riboflavin kinase / FMN adenylyltransferase
MIVHNDIFRLPVFRNAVITVGTFDGVHTGHQQIIHLMKAEAEKVNGETIIITFHPHPRKIVSTGRDQILLLNTLSEKIQLLEKYSIDHIVVIPFNETFANLSAEEYIKDFLVNTFHPNTIIIGHDHHFGKERKGNYLLLEQKALEYKYVVQEIPEHMLHNITISSTKIRSALLQYDVVTACEFLGYNYFFSGKVVEGNKLGRTIGYPTANIKVVDENKLIPGEGVYAVFVTIPGSGQLFWGMMNIGTRPTVDDTRQVIEVNIFDFDKNIYDSILTISIIKHLRKEQKFDGLDSLKNQLEKDKIAALKMLSEFSNIQ